MLDDEPDSLFWSPEQVAAGAIERAGPLALVAAFTRLTSRTER